MTTGEFFSLQSLHEPGFRGWDLTAEAPSKHLDPFQDPFPKMRRGKLEPLSIETGPELSYKVSLESLASLLETDNIHRVRFCPLMLSWDMMLSMP